MGAAGGPGPGAPAAQGPGRSPVVARDFQPQLRHQQPHHVVAAAVQLQGGQVVLRGPLRATAEPAAGSSPRRRRGLLPRTSAAPWLAPGRPSAKGFISPAGSQYTAWAGVWGACSCTRAVGIFSKPATKHRGSAQPQAHAAVNRISERKRNVLPGGERGRKRDYHRCWANPDTRVYSCLFGRRLLSTKVYHQEGMLLTIFTESLKLPLSWNPDKESHLLCLQLLLLLPSSGAVSMSPSPQSGRLYLSTVPHTCGTSCPCDACAGPCAPSHQTLAHTLCWVYTKCRPGADKSRNLSHHQHPSHERPGASLVSWKKSIFGDNTEVVDRSIRDQMLTWKASGFF